MVSVFTPEAINYSDAHVVARICFLQNLRQNSGGFLVLTLLTLLVTGVDNSYGHSDFGCNKSTTVVSRDVGASINTVGTKSFDTTVPGCT